MFSGFCDGVTEVLSVLGCYASLTGSELPTFRDNLSIPSSETKRSKNSDRTTYRSHLQKPSGRRTWTGQPIDPIFRNQSVEELGQENVSIPSSETKRSKNLDRTTYLSHLQKPSGQRTWTGRPISPIFRNQVVEELGQDNLLIPSSETKRSKNWDRTTYRSYFNSQAAQELGQLDS